MTNVVQMRPARGSMQRFFDSFESFLSGLGMFGRDKGVTTVPTLRVLSQRDLQDLYRGDWLSRKICDIPAFDACRAWRNWQAEQDQIEALQETERKFGLQRKLMSAIMKARLYGGSAIIIGVDDRGGAGGAQDARWRDQVVEQSRQWMKDAGNSVATIDKAVQGADFLSALDLDRVGKDSLKFVHVVERWMISAGPVVRDITSPWFGEPNYYMRANTPIIPAPGGVEQLPTTGYWSGDPTATIYIHPSRVVRLIGHDYPDIEMAPDAWGDSVLQTVYEAIKDANTVSQSVASLTARANVNVIKVPGLTNNLATSTGTQTVTNRFANVNAAQSIVNAVLLDKDEEWNQLQVAFGGLPDVLQMYLMIASGAADIPATRLLGREPAGQNATGESDLRNYYDRLSAEQEVKYKPLLSPLDEVIIRTTFGDRDPDLHYDWNPLWQQTPTDKADIAYKKAQAFQIDVNSGLLPSEALAKARENQLIEDGTYPGLESALDEYEEELLEENVPEDDGQDSPDPDDLDSGDVDQHQTEEAINKRPAQDSDMQSALSFTVPYSKRNKKKVPRAARVKYPRTPYEVVRDDKDEFGHGSDPRGGNSMLTKAGKKTLSGMHQSWRAKALKRLAKAEAWARKHNSGKGRMTTKNAGAYGNLRGGGLGLEVGYGDSDSGPVVGTLYVNRPVLNAADIIAYYRTQGVPTTLAPEDMHVTLAYSRDEVDWMKFLPNDDQILIDSSEARQTDRFGDGEALVLKFAEPDLEGRAKYFRDNGASWDWPSYQPHITISLDAPKDMLIHPYTGPILLGPEEFAPVD